MTRMPEAARRERVEQALASHDGQDERLHLHYQGRYVDAPVVSLPLAAVAYNPRSHRIQAQLESSHRLRVVETEPYGGEAQEVIEQILRNTARYEELRDNLRLEGQRDAGVVTRAGVLVNGNTRAAAMAEDNAGYIRVAVLPPDASQQEISEIELELQVARDFKQDYTFTNKLLFISELVSAGRTGRDVARMLGLVRSNDRRELERGEDEVQESLRVLATIRDLQRRAPGESLPLTFFDEAEQAMTEIDKSYEVLRGSDDVAAQRVRNTRLLAVLCGLGYRDIREIGESFAHEYLAHAMTNSDLLGDVVEELLTTPQADDEIELPGLHLLDDSERQDGDLRGLLDLVVSSIGEPSVDLAGSQVLREQLMSELHASLVDATNEARTDRHASNRVLAPIKFMREAGRDLQRAITAFGRVQNDPDFDDAIYEEHLRAAHALIVTAATRAGLRLC